LTFAFVFGGFEDAGQSIHLLFLFGQPGVERHQLLLGFSLLFSTLVEQTGNFTLGRIESDLNVSDATTRWLNATISV
jgi:hypothetical protein